MANFVDPYVDGAAIVSLTDSTTGTPSNTLDDSTSDTKDDLASLAAKINEAKINEIIAVLESKGIISS